MASASAATSKGLTVVGAGTAIVNGLYAVVVDARIIPDGFAATCREMGWDSAAMWLQLSDQVTPWYLHDNGSYIYLNKGDGLWWIDEPSGGGVYVAPAAAGSIAGSGAGAGGHRIPPTHGWRLLKGAKPPAPTVEYR